MKLFNVNISQRNLTMTGISKALPAFFKNCLVARTPSSFGIFVYKDLTSIVTRIVFESSLSEQVLSLFKKSLVSLTYDLVGDDNNQQMQKF